MQKERIELIEILTVENIRNRLEQLTTSSSPQFIINLLQDISALLISQDTRTVFGEQFESAISIIQQLLFPLVESGYIFFNSQMLIKDESTIQRPFAFIGPPNLRDLSDLAFEEFHTSGEQQIDIPVNLVHSHIDTVEFSGTYGTNVPYLWRGENPLHEVLLGRGSIDMKSQVAVIIIGLYLLHSLGAEPPMTILSADEELSNAISKKILANLFGKKLSMDLEPATPDHYFNEILSSRSLIFRIQAKGYNRKFPPPSRAEMLEEIEKIVTDSMPLEDLFLKIKMTATGLYVSARRKDFRDIETLPNEETMVQMITDYISRFFYVNFLPSETPDTFQSQISNKHSPSLQDVFSRRTAIPFENSEDLITDLIDLDYTSRRGTLVYNFATALTMHLKSNDGNMIIFGPREVGEGRHSEIEGGLIRDILLTLANFVEIQAGHQAFPTNLVEA